jgi:hypothetical protein
MKRQETTDRSAFTDVQPRRCCANAGVARVIVGVVMAVSAIGAQTQAPTGDAADFQDYRVIFERNIFKARRSSDRGQEKAGQEPSPPSPAAPTDIRVVGVIQRDDPRSSIAIIEEGDRQRMCRVGDTVGTTVIRDIGRESLVLESAGGRWIAEIQPGTIRHRPATPTPTDPVSPRQSLRRLAGGRLPVKAAEIPHLVGRVGRVVDVHDEGQRGLRLTRDFLGLREGDCVTRVGCQSLRTRHPRQRLWQIARKYSTYGGKMPEIPILVERGGVELEFVLGPYI